MKKKTLEPAPPRHGVEEKELFLREKYSPADKITVEVLRALADGDHDAYRMVYLQFVNPIMNFIERLVRQRSVAEDLTQEIMADVWEKRSRINIHTSIHGYLFTIARNTVSNYFRSKRPIDSVDGEFSWPTDMVIHNSDDMLIARETQMLVQLVVCRMPKQRRTIFEMRNNEGLSNEYIAEKLGITKTAVEKQISYARREIREVLGLFLLLFMPYIGR